jgi:hypothetical protein
MVCHLQIPPGALTAWFSVFAEDPSLTAGAPNRAASVRSRERIAGILGGRRFRLPTGSPNRDNRLLHARL